MLYYLLVVLALFGKGGLGDEVADNAVDTLISALTDQLASKSFDQITLNEFSAETECFNLLWYDTSCSMDCVQGKLGHLVTLERAGDVSNVNVSNKIILSFRMQIRDFYFRFQKCTVKVAPLPQTSHQLSGEVNENSIFVQVSIDTSTGNCDTKLDQIEMDNIDGFNIDFGNTILNKAGNLILHSKRDSFAKIITYQLTNLIQDNIPKDTWCNNIPL